jgi:hypothetical protein
LKLRNLCVAVACAASAGCTTPQPVLDLADKTSANVGIVSARLRQIAAESNRLYASRTDRIVRMQNDNADIRARLAYDKALTTKVGERADLELIDDLQGWVKQVDEIYAQAADGEKQRRDALLARQTKIDAKSPQLQKVAETLSALAKQDSAADRVKFLKTFVVEVRDDTRTNLEDGSESAKAAQALLDKIRGKTPPLKSGQ